MIPLILIGLLATAPISAAGQGPAADSAATTPATTAIPLTNDEVALATVNACGYHYMASQIIGTLYGPDVKAAYLKEHDILPGKYAEQDKAAAAWIADRLKQLAPTPTQRFFYYTAINVRPSGSSPSRLAFDLPEDVPSDFPERYCGTPEATRLFGDLGDIDVCSKLYGHPGDMSRVTSPVVDPRVRSREVTFNIPDGMDITSQLGGGPNDRVVVLKIEGHFSKQCDRHGPIWNMDTMAVFRNIPAGASGNGQYVSAVFVPQLVQVLGVARNKAGNAPGATWMSVNQDAITRSGERSQVYSRFAGALISEFDPFAEIFAKSSP